MASHTIQNLNTDSPRKELFVFHFLYALSKLRSQKPLIDPNKTSKRARQIKTAAYVSMAKAARGTNREWRIAILWRHHRRTQVSKIVGYKNPKKRSFGASDFIKRRTLRRRLMRKDTSTVVDKLRTVVPGGGAMETFKLIVETTHYIKCLSMQVNVMQSIVNALSSY